MRGEYLSQYTDAMFIRELPPRARRILHSGVARVIITGTTSACAENTTYRKGWACETSELPPRARRIPLRSNLLIWNSGTTSACAENTTKFCSRGLTSGNYLRVRGEYR